MTADTISFLQQLNKQLHKLHRSRSAEFMKVFLIIFSTILLNLKKFLKIQSQNINFKFFKMDIFKKFCLIFHDINKLILQVSK